MFIQKVALKDVKRILYFMSDGYALTEVIFSLIRLLTGLQQITTLIFCDNANLVYWKCFYLVVKSASGYWGEGSKYYELVKQKGVCVKK